MNRRRDWSSRHSIFLFSHFHFWGGAGEVGGKQGGEMALKTDKVLDLLPAVLPSTSSRIDLRQIRKRIQLLIRGTWWPNRKT